MQKLKKSFAQLSILIGLAAAGTVGGITLAQPVYAVDCSILPQSICDNADSTDENNGGVMMIVKWVLTIMTGLVGIAAVGGVVWAGIMYTSAGGKADQVKKAKQIIIDVVIGLIAYGLMFIALNWIIPGGVFSS